MNKVKESIRRSLKATPQMKSTLTIAGFILILFSAMCIYSDTYRSMYNITNVITQCVPLACVSLGQTLVIISGGIDLSVGSTISVCTAIAAKTMGGDDPLSILGGFLLVLAAAALIGWINGTCVNYLKVPPMITTLCMGTILEGVALWILPVAGGKINREFARFIYQKWQIVSMPLLIMILLYLLLRIVAYRSKTGKSIYALGKNRMIAASMGVNVNKVSIRTYMICSLCAAITGFLLACRMRVGEIKTQNWIQFNVACA